MEGEVDDGLMATGGGRPGGQRREAEDATAARGREDQHLAGMAVDIFPDAGEGGDAAQRRDDARRTEATRVVDDGTRQGFGDQTGEAGQVAPLGLADDDGLARCESLGGPAGSVAAHDRAGDAPEAAPLVDIAVMPR